LKKCAANNMSVKKHIGQTGEEKAINYLKKNGYDILDRNFRTKYGEIDIIAKNKNEIVFIEVKTRTSVNSLFGPAEFSIDSAKQQKLTKMALQFIKLKGKDFINKPLRFDVVIVYPNDIKIIKNAFSAKNKFIY